MLVFFYRNEGRKLRHIITGLLKSGAATKIKRINYVQSYTLQGTAVQKMEEKMVIVEFVPENQNKVEALLKKSEIKEYNIIKY